MNVYIRGVNSFFSWCEELGYLQNRLKIKLLKVERRKLPQTFGEKDILNWRDFNPKSLSQIRVKTMGLLVLDTGMRVEECLALHEDDIDWKGSRLWIRKGKGGANREVPLSEVGKKALRRFLAQTSDCRVTSRNMPSLVFCTANGSKVSYRNSLRDLKTVGKRLGMGWVGWHSFRRTFATLYIRNGGLLTKLRQILGHASLRTTILYLGDEIEDIVATHDQYSPISSCRKGFQKKRSRPTIH